MTFSFQHAVQVARSSGHHANHQQELEPKVAGTGIRPFSISIARTLANHARGDVSHESKFMGIVRLTQLKIGLTTSACCGQTVLVVCRMDTGVNTAEEGCEERAAAALQA